MIIHLDTKTNVWNIGDIIVVRDTSENNSLHYYLVIQDDFISADYTLLNLSNCKTIFFTHWDDIFGNCVLDEIIPANQIIITR